MSLINDMLKDLEQRNAAATDARPLSGEVRSVPPERRSVSPLLWFLLAVVVIAAATFAWINLGMRLTTAKSQPSLAARPVAPPAMVPVNPPPSPETQPKEGASAPVVEPQPAPAPAALPGPDKELPVAAPAIADKAEGASAGKEDRLAGGLPASGEPLPAVAAQATDVAPPKAAMGQPKPQAGRAARSAASLPIKQISVQQRSENLYRQAISLLQQGRVAEGQDMLQQALGAYAANHDARQLLVGVLVDAGRHAEAMALLQDGLEIAPEQSGFSMALARLRIEAGDRKGALSAMEQGLANAGADAEYHAFLAALLQGEDRHPEATHHYLAALRSNPAMPNWLVGVGISLQAQDMLPDAADAFQRAIDTAQLTPELAQFAEQRLKQIRQQTP